MRNLDGALDRRQQIEALLVAARAAVEEHKAAFKNVKGAPTIARKAKSQRLAAAVVHLERGFLPGEVAEIPQAPPGTLMASARANAQHHALPASAPPGRPQRAASAARDGGNASEDDNGDDADLHDHPGDGIDPSGGRVDDDDDEEDSSFSQFYRVSANQRSFNRASAVKYRKGKIDRRVTKIEPPKVLPNACQPEQIGHRAITFRARGLRSRGLVHHGCRCCTFCVQSGSRICVSWHLGALAHRAGSSRGATGAS